MLAAELVAATITEVILLSGPRPEGVAVLLVLPPDARIEAHFVDDDTQRDITTIAADLLVEYLLRATGDETADDVVTVAKVELQGAANGGVRLATLDMRNGAVGEVPSERLLPLLGAAIAMAVADAVAYDTPDYDGTPDYDTPTGLDGGLYRDGTAETPSAATE
jgi:hypothetical protein